MASEQDIQDVIRTLIAEGIGEGEEGMRRIAETIINRGEQRGLSPAEVVRQRKQYTGYENPGPAAVKAFNDPAALSAAQAAWDLAQGPDDPTGGANHYWNPNIVNPSWAGGMTQLGQFGNHAFATDRAVAQRPRVAPSPAAVAPLMAASRAVTSPTGGDMGLQSALDRVATRERNRVTPAGPDERVTARNNAWVANTPAPVAAAASINDAARRAALTMNQSYAGQERTAPRMERIAPVPASPFDRVTARLNALPVAETGPTTRAVQSVPVRGAVPGGSFAGQERPPAQGVTPASSVAARRAALSIGANQSFAGQDRGAPTTLSAPRFNTPPQLTQEQRLAILGTAQPDDRLPSTPMPRNQVAPPLMAGPYSAATLGPSVNAAGMRTTVPVQAVQAAQPRQAPVPQQRPQAAPLMAAIAPRPMSRPVAPLMAQAPLRVVVQRDAPAPAAPAPSTWAPQGFTNDGSGRITSDDYGSTYYERHLR